MVGHRLPSEEPLRTDDVPLQKAVATDRARVAAAAIVVKQR